MNKPEAPAEEIPYRLEALVRERMDDPMRDAAARFVRHYFARVPDDALRERTLPDLYGAALAHWTFIRRRLPGSVLLRAYNPVLEAHGWESKHTVVEIAIEDMPFLVDTVRMEVNRQGLQVLEVIHPIYRLERDAAGDIREVFDRAQQGDGKPEAVIHLELVRQTDSTMLQRLEVGLRRVLSDLRRAVEDWKPMQAALAAVVRELEESPPPIEKGLLEEARAFLHWMADDHFTFLGYRVYDLLGKGGREALHIVSGSGLGILRQPHGEGSSRAFASLPPQFKRLARTPQLLLLTKANARATVHRPVNLDYVGVRRFDAEGRVIGEHRFLGLYGSRAYSCVPIEIPVVRQKIHCVMQRADLDPGGHSAKALQHILETYPRDELFQIQCDDLYEISMGILELGERQRPRLFLRQDVYGRFVVCLVYVPRERYETRARQRMQQVLREVFNPTEIEFTVNLTDAPMARVLFIVRTDPGALPAYDRRDLEARLAAAVLSWQDDLQTALHERSGEARGAELFQSYGDAFPAGYREDFPVRAAVRDIEEMEQLGEGDHLRMILYRRLEATGRRLRFKVFRRGRTLPLYQVLPILENMGVQVEEEHPYRVERTSGEALWVHDFGLACKFGDGPETMEIRDLFQEAFAQVWHGRMENDGFNALILRARLNWRSISLLRCVAKYLRQSTLTFSQAYMEEAVVANPEVARLLLELFDVRFNPVRPSHAQQRASRLLAQLGEQLDAVRSLDHDRILRSFLSVCQACLRTNFFQSGPSDNPRDVIAIKLDSSRISDLPEPRPLYEIFVYSPCVEGIHLRGGKVARGGLRWSDRREDYRTEILGLMKAQMVKNAVIVPVGAKGGFVVKRAPEDGSRQAMRRVGIECYRLFIAGLLDLTDNLSGEHSRPPVDVVRYDGDDPYLVVAADKGTATFSDIANEVAQGYGFWLGDAFASGGRTGYDHKAIGITARGAWESVRQHFRAEGIDYGRQPFTVVGIGDMSGDVFGNGLLWSRQIKLIAAFDHRHVFIDPDPDPEVSFRERQRLFALSGSSWADYDPSAISEGGGVYSRQLKSVALSPRAQQVLAARAESLTPSDLIRAVLRAPVDLLWNGGIGTYVKASWERNADIGDRINDGLRVDASALRCKVVGEGGNLGLTQAARIEYARLGGRLDSDFIHNAGGVSCSDHEVNIKILLDRIVADGDLTLKQRNRLLAEMTEEVADLVLQDIYWQTAAISLEEVRAAELLPEHALFLRRLEQAGHLKRALEFLPDEEEIGERQAQGRGLSRPEIALVVSYAKHTFYEGLLASDLPEDLCMAPELERYFPTALRLRYRDAIHQHRLRREILCSTVANRFVNRLGSTFVFRLQEELGASAAAVARAGAVVWEVFGLRRLWSQAAGLDTAFPEALRLDILIAARHLASRTCRRLLQEHGERLPVKALIERYQASVGRLAEQLPELLDEQRLSALEQDAEMFEQAGAPAALALWVAGMSALSCGLDLVQISEASQVGVEDVARVYFGLGTDLDLDWLARQLAALPAPDRWHNSARSALEDDLSARHRALCTAILRGSMRGASAASRLEAWRHQHHAAVERYRRLLGELRATGQIDVAMLSVAVREVAFLAASTQPADDPADE